MVFALIILLPFPRSPSLAQSFIQPHMELSKNHEPIGGIETSHALNWELSSFNSNYANDNFKFVYEALGAASGATKYKNVNTNSKNNINLINIAIGVIVTSAIGLIIYQTSDSNS